jgi:hypothetical protein
MADKDQPQQETHYAYSVIKREGKSDYWMNIGSCCARAASGPTKPGNGPPAGDIQHPHNRSPFPRSPTARFKTSHAAGHRRCLPWSLSNSCLRANFPALLAAAMV